MNGATLQIEGNRNKNIIGCDTVAEVVPGWVLVCCHTANTMHVGQYGLHRSSGGSPGDSEVEIKLPDQLKLVDDNDGLTDEQIDRLPDGKYDYAFWRSLGKLEKIMLLSIEDGYRLYTACLWAGYNPIVDGSRIACWLANRIGKAIDAHKKQAPEMNPS